MGSVVAVAITVFCTIATVRTGARLFIAYWLGLCILQNTVAGLMSRVTAPQVPFAETELKTVSLIVAVVVLWPAVRRVVRDGRLGLIAVLYIVLLLTQLRHPSTAGLGYLRNFLAPFLILVLGEALALGKTYLERLSLLQSTLAFVIGLLVVGLAFEMLIGTGPWRALLDANHISALTSISTQTRVFGVVVPRLAGFIVEPTNAGYIAAGGLAIILCSRRAIDEARPSRNYLVIWLFGAALVGSMAKDGFLMVSLAIVAMVLLRRGVSGPKTILLVVCLGCAFLVMYLTLEIGPGGVVALIKSPTASVGGHSTTYHAAGLVTGMRSLIVAPLGHGLGAGGNFTDLLNLDTAGLAGWIGTGAESGFGAFCYQTGIAGCILAPIAIARLARRYHYAGAALLAAWCGATLFHEAILGPQAASLILLGAGVLGGSRSLSETEPPIEVDSRSLQS
ncbi:MAG TPA: hypothetical protein VFP54_12095 [Acidimicrobiales bacterium]|nr:hypothetical protein [Acidimicrobiales bacterium]